MHEGRSLSLQGRLVTLSPITLIEGSSNNPIPSISVVVWTIPIILIKDYSKIFPFSNNTNKEESNLIKEVKGKKFQQGKEYHEGRPYKLVTPLSILLSTLQCPIYCMALTLIVQ